VKAILSSSATQEARARSGDVHAFGELIAEWDHHFRGVVWSVVRSANSTDDVMQIAYEKAFRSITTFRGDSSLKTWIYSICYRAAIDHARYEGRRRHESADVLMARPSLDSPSDTAVDRSELAAALGQLDVETRALFMLTAGCGYSFDEAAVIAGLARGTVASRVGRARKALRHFAETQRQDEETAQ